MHLVRHNLLGTLLFHEAMHLQDDKSIACGYAADTNAEETYVDTNTEETKMTYVNTNAEEAYVDTNAEETRMTQHMPVTEYPSLHGCMHTSCMII